MKKSLNKFCAVILSVTLILCSLSVNVFAAVTGGVCGESVNWCFDADSGVLSIDGTGDMADFLVSSAPWYGNRESVKIVDITNGVTGIGNNAFYGCTAITDANIADSVTDIGNNAFRGCVNLSEVIIPEGTASIGAGAFYGTGLKNIAIPASVNSIGENAFGWCSSIEKITVSAENSSYSSDEYGVLFNKNKTQLIKFPNNSESSGYVIPSTVENISDDAFENCNNLETVTISASVKTIGNGVFFNCDLKNVVVSGDNASYSNDAYGVLFNKDKSELIYYPSGNSVSQYVLPETVKTVNSDAFHNASNLSSVILPDGMQGIGDYTFLFCDNLEYIHIPASVAVIGEEIADFTNAYICSESETSYAKEYADANGYEFRICGEHEAGRKIIASGACGETALWILYEDGELTVSGNGDMADFEEGGMPWNQYGEIIEKVTVNDGITHISDYAFYGCSNLKDVSIPVGIEHIGSAAFYGCESIENVNYGGKFIDWCGIIFRTRYSNPAHYAEKLFFDGKLVEGTVNFEGIKGIASHIFAGYDAITDIVIDESSTINLASFADCKGLTNVIIPDNVKIGAYAFDGCSNLEYIHIPASVTVIGEGAFDNTTAYICSDIETSYAKEYAETNGYEFKLCQKHSVTGVSIKIDKTELIKGKTYTLEAVVMPENAINSDVKWESDNPSVAFVDENGVVSAVSIGSATITVTTIEGGYTASCIVTVKPQSFKIIWIADGKENIVTLNEGEEIVAPADPEKTGYSFTGWSPEIPDRMPADNLTFIAGWSINSYNAVFNANGGKWADEKAETVYSVEYGKRIPTPEIPSRQGYAFAGWTPEIGTMDSVDGKLFTAAWEPLTDIVYTVKTHKMELSGEYTTVTQILTGTTDATAQISYTVEEGYEVNTEKSVLSGVISADGSLVLEIYFDRITYSVTLNGKTSDYIFGEEISEPEVTDIPEGYYHAGWSDENGKKIEFPLVVGTDMPSEINPVFEKQSYEVKWVVDDAETVETYEYQQEIVTPENPSKYGYYFIGWTPEIPDNMPAYDMIFTAVFEKIIYTCQDCGEEFDDETAFNEHVAYENAKKAMRVSIKNNPGTATIKYGETIRLTAVVTGTLTDVKIYWYVDGEKAGEGEIFSLTFEEGTKTVDVKLIDLDGNVIANENGEEIFDSQKVNVNASFWQKIVSFFKNLFRINRVITQSIVKTL